MIAALAVGVAIAGEGGGLSPPHLLDAQAACRLIERDKFRRNQEYSIPGTYRRGRHWSDFTPHGCNKSIAAKIQFDSEASAKIDRYRAYVKEACGGELMGYAISDIFIGKIVKGKVNVPLSDVRAVAMSVFIIRDMKSKELNNAPMPCLK